MNTKNRHWTFIVYPESIKEDWIQVLIETGLPFAISPLHDKDLNADGSIKKPHYHVILTYDGPTTYKSVNDNICQIIGSTIPKRVLSLRGIYRYLTHEDNPEKYQYNRDLIQEFNNFHIDMTDTELTFKIASITLEAEQLSITNYLELINHYLSVNDMDNFKIVQQHPYYFGKIVDNIKKSL